MGIKRKSVDDLWLKHDGFASFADHHELDDDVLVVIANEDGESYRDYTVLDNQEITRLALITVTKKGTGYVLGGSTVAVVINPVDPAVSSERVPWVYDVSFYG